MKLLPVLFLLSDVGKTMKQNMSVDTEDSVWVFGYGSLTWKPGISYTSKQYGYIRGYKRRFWQGNTTHRGTPEKPGRVATLVKDETSVLWGIVYELTGDQIEAGMASLTNREMRLGGYVTYTLDFYDRRSKRDPFPVLVYTATSDCDLYMGPPTSMEQMAQQIVTSRGHAGHNADYVTKLAEFTRKCIPEETDEHLFSLDKMVRHFQAKLTSHHIDQELAFSKASNKQKTGRNIHCLSDDKEVSERTDASFKSIQGTSTSSKFFKCESNLIDEQVDADRNE